MADISMHVVLKMLDTRGTSSRSSSERVNLSILLVLHDCFPCLPGHQLLNDQNRSIKFENTQLKCTETEL